MKKIRTYTKQFKWTTIRHILFTRRIIFTKKIDDINCWKFAITIESLSIVWKPVKSFTFWPFALFGFTTCRCVGTDSMLLPIFPASLIFSTIRPVKDTISFFFIIYIVALVPSSIRPCESSLALHFVVIPESIVLSTVGPIIFAWSLDVIFDEHTVISRSISPGEFSFTVLFALYVLTLIFSTIWPRF